MLRGQSADGGAGVLLQNRTPAAVQQVAPNRNGAPTQSRQAAPTRTSPSEDIENTNWLHQSSFVETAAAAGGQKLDEQADQRLNLILPQSEKTSANCLVTPTITASEPSLVSVGASSTSATPSAAAAAPTTATSQLLLESLAGHEIGLFTGVPSCTPTSADRLASSAINPFFLGATPFGSSLEQNAAPSDSKPADLSTPVVVGQAALQSPQGFNGEKQQPKFASANLAPTATPQQLAKLSIDQLHAAAASTATLSPMILSGGMSPLAIFGLSPEQEAWLRYGFSSPTQHPLAGKTAPAVESSDSFGSQADAAAAAQQQQCMFYAAAAAASMAAASHQPPQDLHYNQQVVAQPNPTCAAGNGSADYANGTSHEQQPKVPRNGSRNLKSAKINKISTSPLEAGPANFDEQQPTGRQTVCSVGPAVVRQPAASQQAAHQSVEARHQQRCDAARHVAEGAAAGQMLQQQATMIYPLEHFYQQQHQPNQTILFIGSHSAGGELGNSFGQLNQSHERHQQDLHHYHLQRLNSNQRLQYQQQCQQQYQQQQQQQNHHQNVLDHLRRNQAAAAVAANQPQQQQFCEPQLKRTYFQQQRQHLEGQVAEGETSSSQLGGPTLAATARQNQDTQQHVSSSGGSNCASDSRDDALVSARAGQPSRLGPVLQVNGRPASRELDENESPTATRGLLSSGDESQSDGVAPSLDVATVTTRANGGTALNGISPPASLRLEEHDKQKPTVLTKKVEVGAQNRTNGTVSAPVAAIGAKSISTGLAPANRRQPTKPAKASATKSSATENAANESSEPPPKKKSRGGRKKKLVTNEEMVARKTRSKERNRVAAKRCRQKRKQFLDELRDRIDTLNDLNNKLQRENTQLKDELKLIKRRHETCSL